MLSTVGLIIDIAIIVSLLIFAIIGLKKGFLHSVLSLFSWAFCLLVAFLTAKYVATWINGIYDFATLIGDKISSGLIDGNNFFTQAVNTFASKEEIIAAIPGETNGFVKQIIKVVFTNSAVDMTSTATIGSIIGYSLGQVTTIVIAGILIFIILKIAVALLTKLFNKIAKTKVLGALNKVLGGILGVLKAGFIILGLNLVLVGLSMLPVVNKTLTPLIQENTYVEKFVYNSTDKLFEKYIVDGELMENWIEDMWENRK